MKIQELRNLIKTADRERLEKAFAESYKRFTKGQKEEVDQIIADALSGKEAKRGTEKDPVDFESLERQIREFLENAYAQNYFAPNRIIPKNQRPKWRFLVKNFIKELEKIPPDSPWHHGAVKLLRDLYHLICEACNYYLFSTDDAFRSIGWEQPELFKLLVKKTFAGGFSPEAISGLLCDATSGGLSRECLHVQQEAVLVSNLNTSDLKYMALEEAKKLVEEKRTKLRGAGKRNNTYIQREKIDNLCDMILMLAIELAEPEKGVPYYFDNCEENDKEIILYRALKIVDWFGSDELWVEVYKYGIKKKIEPRERLRKEYESRREEAAH